MTELQAALAVAQRRKLDQLRRRCRQLQGRVLRKIGRLPGLVFRRIPDPRGDSGFEIYFWAPTARLARTFHEKLHGWNVNGGKTTGTTCHYHREYCRRGLANAPGASPFKRFKKWPAPGYRMRDFPKTEALVHRFVALPLGFLYTDRDADYIAEVVCRIHAELGIGK